jgi:hypothetical protein
MTSKNDATKTPTLEDSIEPAPWPADAQTMKAIIQDEYGSAPEDVLQLARRLTGQGVEGDVTVWVDCTGRLHAGSPIGSSRSKSPAASQVRPDGSVIRTDRPLSSFGRATMLTAAPGRIGTVAMAPFIKASD